MANEIKDKFASSTALTITIASLADAGGRQSTLVDNSTNRYQDVLLYLKIKNSGTAPTANSVVEVYLLRDDANGGTEHASDGAGSSDSAITILNAPLLGVIRNKSSPAGGDVIYGEFLISRPGPKWGIAIVNRTGQTLDSTGSNHWARHVGLNPEVQ
ncbi:MAG: hypothetical protein HY287_05840 [Planctomycetes bacterium]|nr:hypothetical protein [Planctomycetota bacterium]MBI3833833.1 hypothetical protein [Planctomycetota bacterium]